MKLLRSFGLKSWQNNSHKSKAEDIFEPHIFTGFGEWFIPYGKSKPDNDILGPNSHAQLELSFAKKSSIFVSRSQLWEIAMKLGAALERENEVELKLANGHIFKGLTRGDFYLLWMAQMTHPDSGISESAQAKFRLEKQIPDYQEKPEGLELRA